MKKLLVTYDTVDVDGTQGETCCELCVSDVWYDSLFDEVVHLIPPLTNSISNADLSFIGYFTIFSMSKNVKRSIS